jgi:hypothetical protein
MKEGHEIRQVGSCKASQNVPIGGSARSARAGKAAQKRTDQANVTCIATEVLKVRHGSYALSGATHCLTSTRGQLKLTVTPML